MPAAECVSYEGSALPDLLMIFTFILSIIRLEITLLLNNVYKSSEVLEALQVKGRIYYTCFEL